MSYITTFHETLIHFLIKQKIDYTVDQEPDLDTSIISIPSTLKDRHLRVELYEGGYNLHFVISDVWCFDEHDFSETSLYDFISQITNERIVGLKLQSRNTCRDLYCQPEKIDDYIKSRLEQNKDYQFLIRSFHGTYDQEICHD